MHMLYQYKSIGFKLLKNCEEFLKPKISHNFHGIGFKGGNIALNLTKINKS